MISQSDIIADLHTHTIFSKHAYSTVQENITAARNMNLKYLAITDHVYNDGTKLEIKNESTRFKYFEKEINSNFDEHKIYIFGGAEFNIAQRLDHWNKLKKLTWRPIGLHGFNLDIKEVTLEQLYKGFESAAKLHNAFAHIERELHKIDNRRYGLELDTDLKSFFSEIVTLAKQHNVFLEVNESSLRNDEADYIQKVKFWLQLAKAKNCYIYLGSDAHYSSRVGKFPLSIDLINDLDYPKNLILNIIL